MFQCGSLSKIRKDNTLLFRVVNLQDLLTIVYPFFKKFYLKGLKKYNFDHWSKILDSLSKKEHLTLEGVEKLKLMIVKHRDFRRSLYLNNKKLIKI